MPAKDDAFIRPEPSTAAGEGACGPEAVTAQEVRHRHVFYVPGYDPRDPDLYRRLAALELRRFGKLWGVSASVGREPVGDLETPSLGWSARVKAGDAEVRVTYETLRWDDIVAKDFATPLPLKILQGFKTLGDALVSGQLWRVTRAAPWCAVVWVYPVCAFFGAALIGAVVGAGVALAAESMGAPTAVGWPIAAAGAVLGALGVMAALRRAGSFVIHLIDDGRSQRRYIYRRDLELHARIDAFAERIRRAKSDGVADEILIVGHSSGSFIAIDATARIFEAEPDFGEGGPAVALLTVGATELLVGLHPAAGWFRDRLRSLALEPSLFWAEVYGPWDMMNFPNRDPVEELKLEAPADRPNPTFRRAYLTKMLKEPTIAELRRSLNAFRVHFQFIMSNEVRGPFDYFSLVCGPWRTRTQFRRTRKGAYMSPHPGPPVYPPPKAPQA